MVKSAENKQAEMSGTPVAAQIKKAAVRVVVWAVFLGVIYGLWRNPQIVRNMAAYVSAQTSDKAETEENTARENQFDRQLSMLQSQINYMQAQLNSLPVGENEAVDLSRFEDKLEAIEKQNLNVIDSKADVATVLGIITRLDKIEERLDTLAKISDDGALVLTAVMMVKESSENGTNFVYEAEILQQLAKNDKDIQSDVETIARAAREGVKPLSYLNREFGNIYSRLAKVKTQQDMEGKSWKEVLNIKFNEVVKVKRVNDVAAPQNEAHEKDCLQRIRELVGNGDLRLALDSLHQMDNPVLTGDAALQKWMAEAQAKVNFNQAIANISAHSLALMKINTLKSN